MLLVITGMVMMTIHFCYLSACQQPMAYNKQAVNEHINKARLRLEPELE
jgi:hypothetical protein